MDDNNSELEELKIDRQLRKADTESGGARIHMQDGRVSKALNWFWGIVGLSIAGAITLAANNLYQLNITVVRGLDADISRDRQLDDHEKRLRQVERDVNMLAGRNLRGGPEEIPDGK